MRTMIREAPIGVFLMMVVIPLAMAGVAVAAAWHARRRTALIKATKTSPIGTTEDGYREFEGTVEAIGGQTVTAPLTGSPCCWYTVKVEQWTRRDSTRGKHDWVTVRSTTSSAPFLVRDATGLCVVWPYGAEVTPTDRSQWTGDTLEPEARNPPRMRPGESTHGFAQISGGPNSRYRYSEERIYAGDPLVVLGAYASRRFERDLDDIEPEEPSAASSAQVPTPIDVAAAVDETVPDTDAWDRAADERLDTLSALAEQTTKAEIRKGRRGQPLVLTTTSQAAHVAMTEMGSRAALGIALFPLAIAALVLWIRFG
ncbi:MAG: hypothetical protein HY359_13590 [Candidatus Rokubacteria bacterium]|nr:hypothetical protein [Candidatus Rokubacteria bacterium]